MANGYSVCVHPLNVCTGKWGHMRLLHRYLSLFSTCKISENTGGSNKVIVLAFGAVELIVITISSPSYGNMKEVVFCVLFLLSFYHS